MLGSKEPIELRAAVHLDQMQPQFAATNTTNSNNYFPISKKNTF